MRTIKIFIVSLVVAYIAGYIAVRVTHTHRWIDKRTKETGSYTFFDSWSQLDITLYCVFRPLITLDSFLFRRACITDIG
jgi:hypothetical protein